MSVEKEEKIITDKHLSELAKSGITEEICKEYNICSLTEAEVRAKLNNNKIKGGGILIPYPTKKRKLCN